MSDSVLLKRDGAIAEVVINRPEKMNAIDRSVFDGLAEKGEEIRADKSVRAVVLTGAGGNFCAGLDMEFMKTTADPGKYKKELTTLKQGEIANSFQKPTIVWQEIEVPVIAALNGVALGGGTQIALGADIRIAAPDVRMSVMELKWGLVPDMGISVLLPQVTSLDVAKLLTFTAEVFDAERAKALGLVTEICDAPLGRARAIANEIANKNPDAVRYSKKLLNESAAASDPAWLLRLEAAHQVGIMGTPNQMEAVMANMEKRAPVFTDTKGGFPEVKK